MRSARLAVIVVTALALSLTACSSAEESPRASSVAPSTPELTPEAIKETPWLTLCEGLQVVADQLTTLRKMGSAGTATRDDFETRDNLSTASFEVFGAYVQIIEDVENVPASVLGDIAGAEAFWDRFYVPDDLPLNEALAAYKAPADAHYAEVNQIRTEVGC